MMGLLFLIAGALVEPMNRWIDYISQYSGVIIAIQGLNYLRVVQKGII